MNPHEDGPKSAVTATLLKVLVHRRTDRGMRLEPYPSRCVRAGEVHELVATDHGEIDAGARIDRVSFLGFAEITAAGVLDRGDEVWIGERRIGVLLGFDGCHLPNHYNLLIRADPPPTGGELGLVPGDRLIFHQGRAGRPAGVSDHGDRSAWSPHRPMSGIEPNDDDPRLNAAYLA